ncbi:hypothetical protein Emag_000306 [Eimeria magna]
MLRRLLLPRAAATQLPASLVGALMGPAVAAAAPSVAGRLSAAAETEEVGSSHASLVAVCSAAAARSCPCGTWSLSSSSGLLCLPACCSRGVVRGQSLEFHSAAPGDRRARLRRIDSETLKSSSSSTSSSSSSSSSSRDGGGGDLIVSCGPKGSSVSELLGYNVAESPCAFLPRSRRHALTRKPLLPIEPRNLRQPGLRKKKRRRGRGDKSSAKGIRLKRDQQGRFKGPRSRTFEGGKTPLYRRLPKWPAAWLGRFPITQRHLHDSRCVKNNYPFPYKITVDVASADQSSIDAIRRVGGEVRVVYRHPLNLRAHVKPYKFEVLPKTARPGLEAVHFLEKMRARGCVVSYVKPKWLEAEERRLQAELQELQAEAAAASGDGVAADVRALRVDHQAISAYRAKGLRISELEKQQDTKQTINPATQSASRPAA